MRHYNRRTGRELNSFGHKVWTRIGNECLMKGIFTQPGTPPDYCGPGIGWPILNHTIAENLIDKVNGGDREVVAFSPRINPRGWSPNVTRGPLFPRTPIDVAAVGRYACGWHDGLFGPIDSVPYALTANGTVPTLIALRATLMEYFLSFRHSEFFGKRAEYCRHEVQKWPSGPQECDCREIWQSYSDDDQRNAAQSSRRHVPALLDECKRLVTLVTANDSSEIKVTPFFLPGTPTVGGTVVWISHMGDPMTLTIVPVKDGHHFYITCHSKPTNLVQKLIAELLSSRVSNAVKGQHLSEIVLQQHWAMFILKPKWKSMSQHERDTIHTIVDEMGAAQPGGTSLRSSFRRFTWRWQGTRAWALRGDPRVPNLFS